ncbi:lipoyl domain-containing protein, partial [Mesorhizobium marinum]|uniref:lipoyl domain-containing protein n=1 Tax=Mesorhizobium marinum TaxID=3228790 RepID=UPI0034668755
MPVEVILPKVDMDMATGQISRWFVAEGATVKQGDLLFEIETDKAAMEIDSPAAGTIRDIVGKEGVDIAVGSPVAWIYASGETYKEAGASSSVPATDRGAGADAAAATTPLTSASSQDAAAQAAPAIHAVDKAGAVRATPLA